MSEFKVFKCKKCGKVIIQLNKSGCPTMCCGEAMEELKANSTEAAVEKHVPIVTREDDNSLKVIVGSVEHPMTEQHLIEWIALTSENGFRIIYLHAGDKPEAKFLDAEKADNVYAYCNLHGLWKTSI